MEKIYAIASKKSDVNVEELNDEFIRPVLLSPGHALKPDDQLIFFNFRKDRARQMTAALHKADFDAFERPDYTPIDVVCMTQYDEWFRLPYAFQQDKPKTTLSEVVSRANLKQFHCAETEKYAHVTYFLNGRHGDAYEGEDRIIVPSPKVATYDLAPSMSAAQVADEVIDALQSNKYGFIAVNFANGDMVGHTGIAEAIIQAVQTLDTEVGREIKEQFGLEAMEVTEEVFESTAGIQFEQAENRVHSIKALLVATLGSQ